MNATGHVRQQSKQVFASVADGSYDRFGRVAGEIVRMLSGPKNGFTLNGGRGTKCASIHVSSAQPDVSTLSGDQPLVTATTTEPSRSSLPREPAVMPPTLTPSCVFGATSCFTAGLKFYTGNTESSSVAGHGVPLLNNLSSLQDNTTNRNGKNINRLRRFASALLYPHSAPVAKANAQENNQYMRR